MATYINAVVVNDPYRCGIVIKSSALVSSLGGSCTVKITRKNHNDGKKYDLADMLVLSASDLNFEVFDMLVLSGHVYDYNIVVSVGGSQVDNIYLSDIKCEFHGLFVGNSQEYYIAQTNFKTETKQNMAVEYVTTLSGKYPFRVSNSNTNYTTGTSVGLFLELTTDKKSVVPDDYHAYSNRVLDFLCDGTSKILKTHDGQGWYVSIDEEPAKVYSEFMGMNALQFSWTEIGEFPTGLAGV